MSGGISSEALSAIILLYILCNMIIVIYILYKYNTDFSHKILPILFVILLPIIGPLIFILNEVIDRLKQKK